MLGSTVTVGKPCESPDGCRQAVSVRQFQGGADQPVDLFTYRTASERVTDTAALRH